MLFKSLQSLTTSSSGQALPTQRIFKKRSHHYLWSYHEHRQTVKQTHKHIMEIITFSVICRNSISYSTHIFSCSSDNSIFHVKLMWPSDDAVLYTALKDKSDETKQWRVDVLPSLVTFNRMISALENITKCYDKNNILTEIVGTLVQSSGKINVCLDGKDGLQMMNDCENDENESVEDESKSVKGVKDDCQCVKDKRVRVKYQKEGTLVAKNDFEGGNLSTRNHEDHSKVSDVGSEYDLQSAKSAESSEQRPLNESQKQAVKASLGNVPF